MAVLLGRIELEIGRAHLESRRINGAHVMLPEMGPEAGIEPATPALRKQCSTVEPLWLTPESPA